MLDFIEFLEELTNEDYEGAWKSVQSVQLALYWI